MNPSADVPKAAQRRISCWCCQTRSVTAYFFLGGGNEVEPRQNINAIVDNTDLSRDEFKKVVVALQAK